MFYMLAMRYLITFYSFSSIYILPILFLYSYFMYSFSLFTVPAWVELHRVVILCASLSLCRCLVFILCMPVCSYALWLTLCAVYGYYFYLINLFLFSTLLSTLDLSFSII